MEFTPFEFQTPDGFLLRGARWAGGASEVVFSPGTGLTVESYGPALQGLTPFATVHGLNHRGHGGSEVPAVLPEWDDYARDVAAFMGKISSAPPVVAGHSLGALLALRLASQTPRLIRGLVLLDPTLPLGSQQRMTAGEHERYTGFLAVAKKRRTLWPNRAEAERTLRGKGGYAGWEETPFRAFLDSGLRSTGNGDEVELCCPPWLESGIYEGRESQPIWEWIRECRVPTVILRGNRSKVSARHAVEELADLLPIATVLTVKGDHSFAQENPTQTAEALRMAWEILARETLIATPAG